MIFCQYTETECKTSSTRRPYMLSGYACVSQREKERPGTRTCCLLHTELSIHLSSKHYFESEQPATVDSFGSGCMFWNQTKALFTSGVRAVLYCKQNVWLDDTSPSRLSCITCSSSSPACPPGHINKDTADKNQVSVLVKSFVCLTESPPSALQPQSRKCRFYLHQLQ